MREPEIKNPDDWKYAKKTAELIAQDYDLDDDEKQVVTVALYYAIRNIKADRNMIPF